MYQELNTKLKIKRGELVADLFLKLEEADNVSSKVKIYEKSRGKNCNFGFDKVERRYIAAGVTQSDTVKFSNHVSSRRQRLMQVCWKG